MDFTEPAKTPKIKNSMAGSKKLVIVQKISNSLLLNDGLYKWVLNFLLRTNRIKVFIYVIAATQKFNAVGIFKVFFNQLTSRKDAESTGSKSLE